MRSLQSLRSIEFTNMRSRSLPFGVRATIAGVWLMFVFGSALSLTAVAGETSLHQPFDQVLREHVKNGYVDYPAIARDPRFGAYLSVLRETNPATLGSREERLAFWINAYNALAIKGILDGKSPNGFFNRIGFFKTIDYEVGGRVINLYDLEREVIIPMGEPRIHFAIVCASHSCPALRSEAYAAEHLAEQLEENTRRFINDSTRNRFDRSQKVAYLSKIFDWYLEDFERQSGTVLEYVAQYVADPELARELHSGGYDVDYLDYNWTLNGIQPQG